MADELAWLPYLLQTADPLFPTGAYAHSLGFEEIVRLGVVTDEGSLGRFLQQQIVPTLERHELPYLGFAVEAALGNDPDQLCVVDQEISAWKLAREAREASIQLGTRRLKALRVISNAALLERFEESITNGDARGHHLIVCGLQGVIEHVPLHAILAVYFYQSLSAICSAAMKLIRIGQDGCQRVLRTASADADRVIRGSLQITREDAGWFNPLLEIASMRHERAYERLFIS